ncbi:DUF1376 domain-containing protein [Chromobacterium violaceum]|uniref:DUF1376 domain-containing protein n=1 Tax=Chromobacterium violaceum TaxID=536 RepID=UPI001B333735|nr:DUF1376 domain-containing protein [Chromobacterium violaceum]MBP4047762.1 DUF1376 domain-containing protein [Chromobacterium violaceum]
MSDDKEKLQAKAEVDVSIWMPIYIDNFIASTIRLTPQQIGAYILLVCDYWRNNSLPNDDAALSQITRIPLKQWKKDREIISTLFTIEGKIWKSTKLDADKKSAVENRLKVMERTAKAIKAKAEKALAREELVGLHKEDHKDSP